MNEQYCFVQVKSLGQVAKSELVPAVAAGLFRPMPFLSPNRQCQSTEGCLSVRIFTACSAASQSLITGLY